MNDTIKPLFCYKTVNTHKYKILTFSLFCALMGLLISFNLDKQWVVKGVLIIGTNYTLDSNSNLVNTPVEPTSLVIEKLKSKSVQNIVLNKLNIFASENNPKAQLLYNTIVIRPIKDTEAVEISLKANSNILAKQQVEILMQYIINQHNKLILQSKTMLEQKKEFLINQIKEIKDNRLKEDDIRKSNQVLFLNLIQVYLRQINDLNQQLFNVNLALQNLQIKSTKMLNEVQISEKSVFPKKSIFILCGFAIGLLLSTIIVHLVYNKK